MKLGIYGKMMIGFCVVIALMILGNMYVLLELYNVTDKTQTTLTSNIQTIDLAKQLHTILYDEERYAQKYLISRDSAYYALFTESSRLFYRYLDSLAEMPMDTAEQHLVDHVEQSNTWLFATVPGDTMNTGERFPTLSSSDERARADTLDLIHRTLDRLISIEQNTVARSMADIESTTAQSSNVALLLTMGTLIAAILLAFVITRTITRPLDVLVRRTEQIAHGRFQKISVSSKDEIARLATAFNNMSDSLHKINTFKAEMMQHISHELRMPLQTMHSAYYLLTEGMAGTLNERQLKLLKSMLDNVDKISKFSNQFLDLSKIEAGMMEYNFAETDLPAIVQSVIDDAALTASLKGISLNFAKQPVPKIMADGEKCAQIFSNLVSNAMKYTDKGGTIDVAVGPCRLGVQVTVKDTGIGIAESELNRVFAKFYRATSAVEGRRKGTGIGLALVKALVEGHHGTILARSAEGKGSLFTVELPATQNSTKVK